MVTTKMAAAQETHAHFNTSVCHVKGSILVSPVQTGDRPLTNGEAVPGHAYTAHTTAREHTSYTAYTNASQHTSCTSSANSCHTTYIDSRGYDSSIKGLHLSCSPCTSTLKDNSHITSAAQYATEASQLVHTSTPAHNFSPQLQNLIELQILRNIPRTPINIYNLHRELLSHPDQTYVQAFIANLQRSCDIGYRGSQFAHISNNLTLASQQPDILEANIATECQAGHILGPFDTSPLPNFCCSGLGLVPKHDGGWHAIYHLSAPYSSSINDSISSQDYTLSYCSVDDAFAIVSSLGRGALMAKIDLRNAFRLIPVRPQDWNLLGIKWCGKFYIDTCLPFGLRSAPFLFNRLADAIHLSLQHNYNMFHVLHYLDGFFTAGSPGSTEYADNLQSMLSLCTTINAPVKSSKIEGPSTRIAFLGIVIDTDEMMAGISLERKADLILSIQSLRRKDRCTKYQLLSLVGKLSFVCKVIPAGRIFLRRLLDLSCKLKRMHHRCRLTTEACLDLDWWLAFLPTWSGTSYILESNWSTSPSMALYMDASGTLGWGLIGLVIGFNQAHQLPDQIGKTLHGRSYLP